MQREISMVRSSKLAMSRVVVVISLTLGLALPSGVGAAPPEQGPEQGPAVTPEVVPPPAIPTPIAVDPANYRMVLAGDIVIGVGGAALIAMGVGLGLRADAVTQRQALSVGAEPDLAAIARQEQRMRTGTITGLTGGAAAGALFVTGITLVALGYARERRRREALPTVMLGPEGVGLRWSLRF